MAHPHTQKAHAMLMRAGYHSDAAADKSMIRKAIGEHDKQLHGGEHTKLHLARGGAAKHKKGSTHINVIVAPQGGGMGARPVPVPVPAAGGAPMGGPGMARPPMAPPMNVPPGAMPPGVSGRPPGMARGGQVMSAGHNITPRRANTPTANKDAFLEHTEAKRGGAIKRMKGGKISPPMNAGAGGAKGRLEKIKAYGSRPR